MYLGPALVSVNAPQSDVPEKIGDRLIIVAELVQSSPKGPAQIPDRQVESDLLRRRYNARPDRRQTLTGPMADKKQIALGLVQPAEEHRPQTRKQRDPDPTLRLALDQEDLVIVEIDLILSQVKDVGLTQASIEHGEADVPLQKPEGPEKRFLMLEGKYLVLDIVERRKVDSPDRVI